MNPKTQENLPSQARADELLIRLFRRHFADPAAALRRLDSHLPSVELPFDLKAQLRELTYPAQPGLPNGLPSVIHYFVPGSRRGSDQPSPDDTLDPAFLNTADGIGLNFGCPVRLLRALDALTQLARTDQQSSRDALLNAPQHLSAVEELLWLTVWKSPSRLRRGGQFKGMAGDVDWALDACGFPVFLEAKFRQSDWPRLSERGSFLKIGDGFLSRAGHKFPDPPKAAALHIVGITTFANIDEEIMHGIGHELEMAHQIHAVVIRSMMQMTHVISLSVEIRNRVLDLLTVPSISDYPGNHGVCYHWEQRDKRIASRQRQRTTSAISKAVCGSVQPQGVVPHSMPEPGLYRLNIPSRGSDGEPHIEIVPKYLMPSSSTTLYKKKLIEVALPLEAINKEAAREKSIRHGHPSTLHLWWARRPLAACRAVLFASLVDDPSECVAELMKDSAKRKAAERELKARKKLWDEQTALLAKAQAAGISAPPPGPEPKLEDIVAEIERERLFEVIRELVKWENSNNDRVLNAARAEIMRSCNGKPPPVYDPFCGGGSIPLEAQRLGLEAHASDLNPVPVLINKALIEIPPMFAGKPPVNPEAKKKLSASGSWKGAAGLAEDIRYYGQWMREQAEKRIGHLYPKVRLPKNLGGGEATVIAWLWARTVASPNPAAQGAHVPLVRSFWLCTKAGKKAWIEPVVNQSNMSYRFEVHTENGEPRTGTVSRNGGECLLTGSPMPLQYIRAEGKEERLGARLMAIVAEGTHGRVYLSPNTEHEAIAQAATMPERVPDTEMVANSRYMTPTGYGMTKHFQLFTKRQLTALTTLSDLIGEVRDGLMSEGEGYAGAVATYLAFAVSKGANYWSSICKWHQGAEKMVSTFGLPVLPMAWDYTEANPFSDSSGNWSLGVEQAAKSVAATPASGKSNVFQADAGQRKTPKVPWLVSTDPPYYDNVPYADLSDLFYIWLRRTLQVVYPELLSTLLVPKKRELVADPFRQGGKVEAQKFFEQGLGEVFRVIREESAHDFPFTVFYAFKQQETEEADVKNSANANTVSTGWETMLEALISSGFSVDGTWPMRTEQSGGLREAGRNSLASSIVLVCRVRPKDAGIASRRDFLAALKKELPVALRHLQKGNIAPVDLAQAAIGPGMAVFSRYVKVLETDGTPMRVRTALALINQSLDEVLAEQEGEFDADTRWALAWFDQNGFNEGAYGVAETLCTAKNTSVSGMAEAGILTAKGGKVRLLEKEELDADWNPATDRRLTIWEITHHLIRRLEQGETGAAELIQQLGARAEVARDLSYRLYTICERRKWSQEAIAYNTLVLSWSDVQRLALEKNAAGPTQGELL